MLPNSSRASAIASTSFGHGGHHNPHSLATASASVVGTSTTSTRFQEAASSLNRNKQFRHMGLINPQQVQINLDHDYCSSTAKMRRSRLGVTCNPNGGLIRPQPHPLRPAPPSAPVITPVTVTHTIRKPSIVVSSPTMNFRTVTSHQHQAITIRPETQQTVHHYAVRTVTATRPTAITVPIAVEVNVNQPVSPPGGASPLSSPARKDSGLESGEVSDASDHGGNPQGTPEAGRSTLYSKVPPYLTSINVANADSRSERLIACYIGNSK